MFHPSTEYTMCRYQTFVAGRKDNVIVKLIHPDVGWHACRQLHECVAEADQEEKAQNERLFLDRSRKDGDPRISLAWPRNSSLKASDYPLEYKVLE